MWFLRHPYFIGTILFACIVIKKKKSKQEVWHVKMNKNKNSEGFYQNHQSVCVPMRIVRTMMQGNISVCLQN